MTSTPKDKQHDAGIKEIARIQNLKGAKQWKAAQQFALKVNPALAQEHKQHLQELEELREQMQNPTARSANGLRFTLSIPETIISVIQKFDPDFMMFDKSKYKTKDGSNAESRKLMRVFPEYTIPTES